MRTLIPKIALVVALLLLPFLLHEIYRRWTALPERITVATGPEGGRYYDLTDKLKLALERELPVTVEKHKQNDGSDFTQGSRENIRLLKNGSVQFALYQRGSHRKLAHSKGPADSGAELAFVANLYPETTLFFVRHELHDQGLITRPPDLRQPRENGDPRAVAVGLPESGEIKISRAILDHFQLNEPIIETKHLTMPEIERQFAEGRLDAAFVTAGIQAPIFKRLIESGHCKLGRIPEIDAILTNHVALSRYTVPTGLYHLEGRPVPTQSFDTLAVRAQLLTRADVPSVLVERVTNVVLSEDFVRENKLAKLARERVAFARQDAEFPIHQGAMHVYEPELKPLVNPDFMDAAESLRSFAVSFFIGGFILYRAWSNRREKQREHRLDQYINALLDIDRRQSHLDDHSGGHDVVRLQKALDEVTKLHREALGDFTAPDMGEEPAVDCFLTICHAVSDKINDKLLRQRLDLRFEELRQALAKPGATGGAG